MLSDKFIMLFDFVNSRGGKHKTYTFSNFKTCIYLGMQFIICSYSFFKILMQLSFNKFNYNCKISDYVHTSNALLSAAIHDQYPVYSFPLYLTMYFLFSSSDQKEKFNVSATNILQESLIIIAVYRI